MAVSRVMVEELLDEMEVVYFCRVDRGTSQWVLVTAEGPVYLSLSADGENLCFQSSDLVDLSSLAATPLQQLQAKLLHRNNLLVIGHYSIHDKKVFFESWLVVKDSVITKMQLEFYLGGTVFGIEWFRNQFRPLQVTDVNTAIQED